MSALHVVFRVGDAEYAVPADDVLQMESYTGATKVPGTAPYVAGLMQIRRKVVPVVDLRRRFGLEPREPTAATRVVVLNAGARTVALLVDSAREVQQIPEEQIRPPPDVVAQQSSGFVRSVAQVKDRLLMLIDVPKVLGEEVPDGH